MAQTHHGGKGSRIAVRERNVRLTFALNELLQAHPEYSLAMACEKLREIEPEAREVPTFTLRSRLYRFYYEQGMDNPRRKHLSQASAAEAVRPARQAAAAADSSARVLRANPKQRTPEPLPLLTTRTRPASKRTRSLQEGDSDDDRHSASSSSSSSLSHTPTRKTRSSSRLSTGSSSSSSLLHSSSSPVLSSSSSSSSLSSLSTTSSSSSSTSLSYSLSLSKPPVYKKPRTHSEPTLLLALAVEDIQRAEPTLTFDQCVEIVSWDRPDVLSLTKRSLVKLVLSLQEEHRQQPRELPPWPTFARAARTPEQLLACHRAFCQKLSDEQQLHTLDLRCVYRDSSGPCQRWTSISSDEWFICDRCKVLRFCPEHKNTEFADNELLRHEGFCSTLPPLSCEPPTLDHAAYTTSSDSDFD